MVIDIELSNYQFRTLLLVLTCSKCTKNRENVTKNGCVHRKRPKKTVFFGPRGHQGVSMKKRRQSSSLGERDLSNAEKMSKNG